MNRDTRRTLLCICILIFSAIPLGAQAQDLLACSCTGSVCGNGAIQGNQGDVFTEVSESQADEFFFDGIETGWTCVVPSSISGEGGPLACFCENLCGGGAVGGSAGTFRLGLTQDQVNSSFGGGEAGNGTGWLCGDYRGAFSEDGPPPQTFAINAGLNDAWADVSKDGQGFYLAVFPETGLMALSWFTYDVNRPPGDVTATLGGPGQRWLSAAGGWEGTVATLGVEKVTGGRFDRRLPLVERDSDYGTIVIEFHDCDSATLLYEIPELALTGEMSITRIVKDNVSLCQALSGMQAGMAESDLE
jgi:hypothetical protein